MRDLVRPARPNAESTNFLMRCIKARLASCSAEDRVRFVQHPLTYFTQWVDSDDGLEEMCWKCMDSMRANYHVWLRDVWRRLPSFFNLPDWTALAEVRKLDLTVGDFISFSRFRLKFSLGSYQPEEAGSRSWRE